MLEDGTAIAAELEGHGVIWRSWSAMPGSGAVRIWVDGECIIDRPFIEYFTRFGGALRLPTTRRCAHTSREATTASSQSHSIARCALS